MLHQAYMTVAACVMIIVIAKLAVIADLTKQCMM